MKKIFLLTLILLACVQVYGQDSKPRKRYFNLGFARQDMKFEETDMTLKSNFGASLAFGRTFFLHKNPVAGMIRFGIDATWIDITYTNYKVEFREMYEGEYESEKTDFHQAEIAMNVGPSITVTPVKNLSIHGYFRYAPSFSAFYDSDAVRGGYASYFLGGGSVSYGVIGLGVEARFGNCKYKEFGGGDSEDDEYDGDSSSKSSSLKNKFSGMRVYLSFRF